MLKVELEGYFPVDGSKFREAYYCTTDDQQLAVVEATQFVLIALKNYHKGVIFTGVFVVNVDSRTLDPVRTSYGRGIAEGMKKDEDEKFPSADFFKEKAVEHHASQEAQAAQKIRHDPFTESK